MFEPVMDDVTAGCKKILGCNEELHTLHSSPYAIRKIKVEENETSRACSTDGEEVHVSSRKENLNERDLHEDLRIVGRMVL
jgi:hypothetical protein